MRMTKGSNIKKYFWQVYEVKNKLSNLGKKRDEKIVVEIMLVGQH